MVLTRAPYGSLYAEKQAIWAPAYEARLGIIGSTGIIVPLFDANHENAGRTTTTSIGEEQLVYTHESALTDWDVPPTFIGPSTIPLLTFNGTGEQTDTPDINYFSRDDTSGEPWSLGFWGTSTAAGSNMVMSKYAGGNIEWRFAVITGRGQLEISDQSVQKYINRAGATQMSAGVLSFIVATYDGAGGASAADSIHLYFNGVLDDGSATNDAAYVGMENGTAKMEIGARSYGSSNIYEGTMVGGPLGPIFTQIELTADQVLELYQHDRALLGV